MTETSKTKKDDTMLVVGPYEESWEPKVAERIRDMVLAKERGGEEKKNDDDLPLKYPYCMVALCGIPGSGKTISSFILANKLESYGIESTVLPMDGYHHFLDFLRSFPDPEDAIYRRGAPDTFDPQALLRDLAYIKGTDGTPNGLDVVHLPGFDHAKGDPEPNKHIFDRSKHKVVICEGLYLLHDADGWEDVRSFFDLKIFMEADVDNCIERLKIRNQCIPGYSPSEIALRCEKVDRANALLALESKKYADLVVRSPTVPLRASEKHRRTPSKLELALASLEFKDIDEARGDKNDWTMEIMSFPRSPMLSRANSMVSVRSESDQPPPPSAASFVGSWEPQMADKIIQMVQEKRQNGDAKKPFMVALVGGPGTGKSVSAMLLASILDAKKYATMVTPHDGYHYSMDFLRTFPDAQDVIYRRGAPDTFDPISLLRDLDRIRNGDEDIIKLPAFDHAKGDPEPETHIFDRNQHKIVLCEGLYLLHDQDGWEDIASMFDLTIFMDSDVDVCMERVKIRNQCIPGYAPEEIEERCEKVDRVNAMTVMRSKARADVVVGSTALKQ
jgi:pantothenate kinase